MPRCFSILSGFWSAFAAWVLATHFTVATGGTVQRLTTLLITGTVACGLAGAVALTRHRGRTSSPSAPTSDGQEWMILLAAITAVLGASWFVPTEDDALTGSLATSVTDFPELPLASFDWLHGLPEVGGPLTGYELMTLELLAGTLAWFTNTEALLWAHQVFPALFGFATGLGWCLLLHTLAPERWRTTYLFMLAFWVLVPHTMYSWFGMLHVNKALLPFAVLPFVWVAVLRFVRDPSVGGWCILLVSQISAAGLNPTGLWFGPTAIGTAVLASPGFSPPGAWRRRIPAAGLALLAALYPLGIGVGLFVSVMDRVSENAPSPTTNHKTGASEPSSHVWSQHSGVRPVERIQDLIDSKKGWDIFEENEWPRRLPRASLPLFLGSFFLVLALGNRAQRYFLATNAIVVTLLFNPWAASVLSAFVIPGPTHWRVLWLYPGALVLALALSLPLASRFQGASTRSKVAWMSSVLLGCATLYAEGSLLPSHNPTFFSPFAIRQPSYSWYAQRIGDLVAPGSTVLVPSRIAPWVVTYRDHPQPLIVRVHYRYSYSRLLSKRETRKRERLLADLDPKGPRRCRLPVRRLGFSLDRYDIRAIALDPRCRNLKKFSALLTARGFQRDEVQPPREAGRLRYQLWWRPDP